MWGGAGLVTIFLIAMFCIAEYIRKPNEWVGRRLTDATPANIGCAFEEVSVSAPDGTELAGWFIPHRDAAGRTLVMLHGINSNKANLLDRAKRLREVLPINLCLMDLRAHGRSGGTEISYGVTEWRDVKAVIDHLADRKDVNRKAVGVLGESLGAAVALQAAGHDPLIAAVVAQAAFTDLGSAVDDRADRLFIPRAAALLVRFFCEIRTEWGWADTDLRPVVAGLKCPVLLIHGERDTSTKPAHSQELLRRCGSATKELWLVPGAGHSRLAKDNAEEYARRVGEFLRKALPARDK